MFYFLSGEYLGWNRNFLSDKITNNVGDKYFYTVKCVDDKCQ